MPPHPSSWLDPDDMRQGVLDRFARKRDLAGLSPSLARSGSLEARLALTKKDVRRAQKLRYRVFFEEGGAVADATARLIRRDVCRFDKVCDHLIVVDHAAAWPARRGQGCGRLSVVRQDVAERNFGFYSAGEFDVGSLIAHRPELRFLEVGRACIAASHRGRHVLDLLWRGLWAYARHHKADVLIGCASSRRRRSFPPTPPRSARSGRQATPRCASAQGRDARA